MAEYRNQATKSFLHQETDTFIKVHNTLFGCSDFCIDDFHNVALCQCFLSHKQQIENQLISSFSVAFY